MIGAIILTIYHEEKIKRQDLFSQIATEYQQTVYLSSTKARVATEIY
jgi:hypothetical protein